MFTRLRQPLKQSSKLNKCYGQRFNQHRKNQQVSYLQQHKIRKANGPFNYQIVSSQNYLYQGQFNHATQKNGQGILFTKKGCLIIGNWNKNQLNGRALIVTGFGALIYATFLNGLLDGWSVADYAGKVIICTRYFNDKIDGERIIFEKQSQMWVASKYNSNGKFISITHVEKGVQDRLPSFSIDYNLSDIFQITLSGGYGFLETQRIVHKQITREINYIGYIDDIEEKPTGLGFIFSHEELYIGNFKEGALDNYGRIIFSNGDIYHGQFNLGNFQGRGSFYQTAINTSIVVESINNKFVENVAQQKGYISIDIDPCIGKKYKDSFIGVSGNGLIYLTQFIEQYYYCYSVERKRRQKSYQSHKSQYNPSQRSEISSPKASKSKIVKRQAEQWIEMKGHSSQEEQLPQISRSRSLDKRQAKKKNFQTTKIAQNYQSKQRQTFNKKSPNVGNIVQSKMLKERNNEMPQIIQGQITFRNRLGSSDEFTKNYGIDGSNEESQLSNLSLKVDGLLKETKEKRKRSKIFH